MTLEEAKKVAAICSTADDGCPYCVKDLCNQLALAFPQFEWAFDYPEGDDIEVKEKSDAQS
jgi:hypothetical protein